MAKNSRRTKKQRGGGGYGNFAFTGPAGVSAGGVPFESRAADNAHCAAASALRPAPQLGGACNSCGAQRGGGGGTGGFGFDFGNNALGKVYASLPVGPCPPAPQKGGEASYRDLAGTMSYPSGYGFDTRGVVSTASAHYLDPSRYARACMGGGGRRSGRRTGRRSGRRTGRRTGRRRH